MVLTAITVFLLSVYNGPSAAMIDELGPPQFAATLQANTMFWIHVLGNATGRARGWLARRPLGIIRRVGAASRGARLRGVGGTVHDRRSTASNAGSLMP